MTRKLAEVMTKPVSANTSDALDPRRGGQPGHAAPFAENPGATVVAQNLQRRDVKVLAVDDVDLRKGDASTACSVFIDGETLAFW